MFRRKETQCGAELTHELKEKVSHPFQLSSSIDSQLFCHICQSRRSQIRKILSKKLFARFVSCVSGKNFLNKNSFISLQAYLSHMIALPVKIFILKNFFSFNSFILHTQGTPAMYGRNHYQLDNALDKSQVLVVSFRAAFRPVVAYLHFSCSTVLT